jgi:flavin-dependent dehydrogenase
MIGLARGGAPFGGRRTATDLVIVGGGPAGLATAIHARLAGLSVRVLERAQPPVDKACGEGLMPDAVQCLADLGVELPGDGCSRFRGIRYLDGEVVAEGVFPPANLPGEPAGVRPPGGVGVRRLVLHRALAARAEHLGADLCWGVSALALAPAAAAPGRRHPQAAQGVMTDRGLAAARWVVGADGLRSRVRAWAGLEAPAERRCRSAAGSAGEYASEPTVPEDSDPDAPETRAAQHGLHGEQLSDPDVPETRPAARQAAAGGPPPRRFGMRRHFAVRHWCDMVEVYWGPGCEAYVTPTAPGEVGVALLWNEAQGKVGFDTMLARFPALVERLAAASAASRVRGCGPLKQRAGAVVRGNVVLVGDAAGYLDAITGEGIAVALHHSAALIGALASPGGAGLDAYAAAHARIGRLPDAMTSAVLALERRPWLRRRAVRALAADPALFSRLLGIHARTLPPSSLGFDGALRLVYRLVTA